jgi:hypothetical protein
MISQGLRTSFHLRFIEKCFRSKKIFSRQNTFPTRHENPILGVIFHLKPKFLLSPTKFEQKGNFFSKIEQKYNRMKLGNKVEVNKALNERMKHSSGICRLSYNNKYFNKNFKERK